jgi:gamma-glutamylcyclotransferase (GGCT)/AIG2-like uncharacterized protein YtfP
VDVDPGHSRHLLVYGTLRVGMPKHGGAVLPELVAVATGLRIPGRIYDVGEYPAVVLDHRAIRGEAAVTDSFVADVVSIDPAHDHDDALADLDAYEQGAADQEQVEYRRALVPTGDPAIGDAWVYEWVGPTDRLAPITDGEWRP